MRKIRIGNDIDVTLKVNHGKDAADFTGKDLSLFLVSPYEEIRVYDFKVEDNVISFTYKGVEQKHLGRYYITLYEKYGDEKQNVGDTQDAFVLVPRSTQINDTAGGNGFVSLDVNMAVDLDWYESN